MKGVQKAMASRNLDPNHWRTERILKEYKHHDIKKFRTRVMEKENVDGKSNSNHHIKKFRSRSMEKHIVD
jgi:hypothetical protein